MSTEKGAFGVHSEAGRLRKVMVCSPGLAHQRLTPSNCDDLLFDDVIWVSQAKRDHFDFVTKMRERGVDVVEMHNLLTETVRSPEGLKWLLDRKIRKDTVGVGLAGEVRQWLESLEPRKLAEFLIGGVSAEDMPETGEGDALRMFRQYLGYSGFVLAPLPNTLFTRDTTCWIYGGVSLNPMHWPARRQETLLTTAIYKFHPDFAGGDYQVWYGDPDKGHGFATLEGGDVMPIGNRTLLVGMGERTTRQAIGELSLALFAKGAVDRVIVAGMPKSRAAMHLDTVFSFCDRDLVTIFPDVVGRSSRFRYVLRKRQNHQSRFVEKRSRFWMWSLKRSDYRSCGSSRPAATPSRLNGNSGTTATTWSAFRPVSWSATTGTPIRIPCFARPEWK